MTTRHQHVCGCGDFLMCSQDADKCPRFFQCPRCEMEQRDEFFDTAWRIKKLIDRMDKIDHSLEPHKEPN